MSNSPYFLALRSPRTPQPNAPLFIYLPGGDGTGQLLYRQLEGLERTFDIRCLEIPRDDLTSWDQLVEQVVALVEAELKKRPRAAVYLCGESFGGCLALKVVHRAPQLFNFLTLVNPASNFRSSWLYWPSFLARPMPDLVYWKFWLGFLPILASLGRIEPEDRRNLLTAVLRMSQETSIWRVALLREFQFSDTNLRQIKQPTLVLASGRDLIFPSVEEAERLTGLIPNSKTYVLPESGHACLLETDVHLHDILQLSGFLPQPQPVTER